MTARCCTCSRFALFGSLRCTPAAPALAGQALFAGIAAVCLIGLLSRVLPHTWPTASSFFARPAELPAHLLERRGHARGDRADPRLPPDRRSRRALERARLRRRPAAGDRRDAAAHVLARRARRRRRRPARLLPADAPEHAPRRAARGRAGHGDRAALRVGRDRCWPAQHPTSPAAVVAGPPRGGGRRRLHARRGPAARGAAARSTGRSRDSPLVRTPRSPRGAAAARRGRRGRRRSPWCSRSRSAPAASPTASTTNSSTAPSARSAAQTRERLSDPGNNGRLPLWEAAVRIYDTQKLHGTGAGTYQLYYFRYRTNARLCHRRPLAVPAEPGRARDRRLRADPRSSSSASSAAWPRGSAGPTERCMRRCSRWRWPGRSTRRSTGTGRCRRSRSACSCSPGSPSRARATAGRAASGLPAGAHARRRSAGWCSPSRRCS